MRKTVFLGLFLSCLPVSLMLCQPEPSRVNANLAQIRNGSATAQETISLQTENAIDFVQFSSDKVGWLGSQSGELRSTIDGGSTWRRVNFGTGGFLARMLFVSDSAGWVVVDNYSKDLNKIDGTRANILQTSDGGKTWTTQLDIKSVELVDFKLATADILWVLGSKFKAEGDIIASQFVLLQSKNGGAEWIDRSDQLNSFLRDATGRVLESAAALFAPEPHTLIVLTRNGTVLKSPDEGQNWSRVVDLNTNGLPAQRLIGHTSFPLILAGMGGNHGTASLLIIRNDDGSITSNELGGTYIKDVLSIPGTGLIACGFIRGAKASFQTEGVVLFSADSGSSWSTLYRGTNVETINSLAWNGDVIWGGGPRGQLVKLRMSKTR